MKNSCKDNSRLIMPISTNHDTLTGRVSQLAYQSGSTDHRSSNSPDPHTGGCWPDSWM